MKILFDGGAFQQGIGGGILNVAVNFLNAATQARPDFSYVLLADPLFGEVRPEFLAKLVVRPEIVYRSVLKSSEAPAKILTWRLGLQVLIDGKLHQFEESDDCIAFSGEAKPRTIEILSRTAQPRDVIAGSRDVRRLGVAFSQIDIEAGGVQTRYYFDDPRFDEDNHFAEAEHRWTMGRLRLPAAMLPAHGPWRVRIKLFNRIPYTLFEGRFDAALDGIAKETRRRAREHELGQLADDMRSIGVQGYCANHFLPIRLPGLPLFTWAYDIIPVIHPEFFNKDALDNFAEVVKVLTAADATFCISRFTKQTILKHLPIDESRLHVSWIGVSPEIHRRSEAEVAALRSRYALSNPYLVCVATIEPRKNHVTLVEAYDLLLKAMPEAPDLVVAGTRGWGYDAFFQKITALGLSERVRHLENLGDDEVAMLYSGAEMCVYPSLFEGFGLPVLEAMHCGIPVVTSRGTSMEEIVEGGAGLLSEPTSAPAIAKAMELILRHENRREALLAAAAARLPLFDWSAIARSVLDVMEDRLR
ncbi:glycosyltransferase family 4 protein [uncultured Methylobacterium sp.]|uniref:glycosyltransferase family 4 protein n=1 Tax=uncultured Methylobacterium sp. TaxID=157278 RepID=UPI0035C9DB63